MCRLMANRLSIEAWVQVYRAFGPDTLDFDLNLDL